MPGWSPIQSVIIRVIPESDNRARESDLFITSMIADRNGRHEVLLIINNFREKKNSQVMKKEKSCIERLAKEKLTTKLQL